MSENIRSSHSSEELEEMIKKFQESENEKGGQPKTYSTKISDDAYKNARRLRAQAIALNPRTSSPQTEKATPPATPKELQKEIDENRRKRRERLKTEETKLQQLDAESWSKLTQEEQNAILESSIRHSGSMP